MTETIAAQPLGLFGWFFPSGIGWTELLILGVIILLLFGRRLPAVAWSVGRSIVEFKKGVKGIEDKGETTNKTTN